MAHITITVKNNLFTIETDRFGGLTVNGEFDPQGSNRYEQKTPGPIDFTTTSTGVELLHPDPSLFIMQGETKTHMAVLNYSEENGTFKLQGLLINVDPRPDAKPGPYSFSQGALLGEFREG